MKTIWKFPLDAKAINEIEMPAETEILTVQTQNETACMWALVDVTSFPKAKKEKRRFATFGTGHTIPENCKKENYIGSFQLQGGALIFHVFEI